MRAAVPAAQLALIAVLLAAIALANVRQPFPELAPLQHGPTLLLALAAPWLLRRWPMPTRDVAAAWLFLLLHTLGARYIYSHVPYDAWAVALSGEGLSARFHWERNHYDRFVHFAFGLLLTLPCAGLVQRIGATGRRLALAFAFCWVGLVSALYEMFEWGLTMIAAPDFAEGYNGQQGDIWDAQKDMALAQAGSGLALVFTIGRALLLNRTAMDSMARK